MNYKGIEEKYLKLSEENVNLKQKIEDIDLKLSEENAGLHEKTNIINIKIDSIYEKVFEKEPLPEKEPVSFIPLGQGLASIAMVMGVYTAKSLFDANWILLTGIVVVFLGLIGTIGDRK